MFLFTLNSEAPVSTSAPVHQCTYVLRRAYGRDRRDQSNNMIVGAFSFANIEAAPLRLARRRACGVFRWAMKPRTARRKCGEERVKNVIRAEAPGGSKHLEQKLLETIQISTTGAIQTDDITIINR